MEITETTAYVYTDYETQMLLYGKMNIIGLAVIAGCIIASVVMRWFHRG